MGKLILIACGAGINTSTIAEDTINERLQKEGIHDVDVKRVMMQDIDKYVGQMSLVVSMMKMYRQFDVPQLKGMPFLIGTQEEKEVLLKQIVDHIKSLP